MRVSRSGAHPRAASETIYPVRGRAPQARRPAPWHHLLWPGLLLLGATARLWGYCDVAHRESTRAGIRVVQQADREGQYAEIYRPEHEALLVAGAGGDGASDRPGEDYGVVAGNERSFRHYYDPRCTEAKKGVPWSWTFWVWKYAENAAVSPPAGGRYDGALEWARDCAGTGNPRCWAGAILAYDHTPGSRAEAYYRLGHCAHLLEDMAEPDHATNTPHPGSSFSLPRDGKKLLVLLDKLPGYSEVQVPGMGKLGDLLKPLLEAALKAHPNQYVGFEELMEREMKTLGAEGFVGSDPIRLTEFDAYYNQMAQSSINEMEEIGGESAWVPLGCDFWPYEGEDASRVRAYIWTVQPLYDLYQEATDPRYDAIPFTGARWLARATRPLDSSARKAKDRHYKMFPATDIHDSQDYGFFASMGRRLLTLSTRYSAGLLQHFHDIVNPPPHARRVEIKQNGITRYAATWQDYHDEVTGTYDVPVGRRAIPFRYEVVRERRLEPDYEGGQTPLLPGAPCEIRIEFGNEGDAAPELMDEASATLGGVAIDGKFDTDGRTWVGRFTPALADDKATEKQALRISATDRHNHFEDGRSLKGLSLDADPASPSKRITTGRNAYEWRGYQEGDDQNHAIDVGQEYLVRVRVVDQAGATLSGDGCVVTVDGAPALPSRDEFWRAIALRAEREPIEIEAGHRMPDGESLSANHIIHAVFGEPPPKEPAVIRLPFYQKGSFMIEGDVTFVPPAPLPDDPGPPAVLVHCRALDAQVQVGMPGGQNRVNSIRDYFVRQIEEGMAAAVGDPMSWDGHFRIGLEKPVRAGSAIEITAEGRSGRIAYHGSKMIAAPTAPGLIRAGTISMRALKASAIIPAFDPRAPPHADDYEGRVSGAGFRPKRLEGPAAPAAHLAGHVAATDPPAGSEAPLGSEVAIQFFAAFGTPVPDVTGLSVTNALERLGEEGFRNVTQRTGDAAPSPSEQGTVAAQSVAPGTTHPPDKPITLIIYAAAPSFSVPDLSGQSETDARDTLGLLGLKLAVAGSSEPPPESRLAGTAYRQKPTRGTLVAATEPIEVWFYSASAAQVMPPADEAPYYAAFTLVLPQAKPGVLPKKQDGESKEAYRARKRQALAALTEADFTFEPLPREKSVFVIHVGAGALARYPRGMFRAGEPYAVGLDAAGKDSEQRPIQFAGKLLLVGIATHATMDEVLGQYPVLRTQKNLAAIDFATADGFATQTNPQGTFRFGPITPGWTPADKTEAIRLMITILGSFDCFIAGAAYGDPWAPQVEGFRRFRDEILRHSAEGRRFIEAYYARGPAAAVWLKRHPRLIAPTRRMLDSLLPWLRAQDLQDPATLRQIRLAAALCAAISERLPPPDGDPVAESPEAFLPFRNDTP